MPGQPKDITAIRFLIEKKVPKSSKDFMIKQEIIKLKPTAFISVNNVLDRVSLPQIFLVYSLLRSLDSNVTSVDSVLISQNYNHDQNHNHKYPTATGEE